MLSVIRPVIMRNVGTIWGIVGLIIKVMSAMKDVS